MAALTLHGLGFDVITRARTVKLRPLASEGMVVPSLCSFYYILRKHYVRRDVNGDERTGPVAVGVAALGT